MDAILDAMAWHDMGVCIRTLHTGDPNKSCSHISQRSIFISGLRKDSKQSASWKQSICIRRIGKPPGILDAINKEPAATNILNERIDVVINGNVVFLWQITSEGIGDEGRVE